MLFALPNNTPAHSQRYGIAENDYEVSPRKKGHDSSISPRNSKIQQSPRVAQSLNETKYRAWKDIMHSMENRGKE
jgi:hypothetical protein